MTTIKVIKRYFDTQLRRTTKKLELLTVTAERAEIIVNAGFAKVVKVDNTANKKAKPIIKDKEPKTVKKAPVKRAKTTKKTK